MTSKRFGKATVKAAFVKGTLMFSHRLWLPLSFLLFLALACSLPAGIPSGTHPTVTQTATATLTPTPAPTNTPAQDSPDTQKTPSPTDAAPPKPFSSPEPPFPDLNGVWVDNGLDIVIVQNGYSVSASYIDEKMCDDRNGNISPYPYDFSATLQQEGGAWQLSGKTIVCSYGKDNPNGTGPKETDIKIVLSQDQSSLVGDWYDDFSNQWRIGDVSITRKFVNGAPVPTPAGYTPPTLAP